jgi:hypothetical protein
MGVHRLNLYPDIFLFFNIDFNVHNLNISYNTIKVLIHVLKEDNFIIAHVNVKKDSVYKANLT